MPMQRNLLALALAFAVAACDENPQEPSASLSETEVEDLAAELSDLGYAEVEDEFEAEAFTTDVAATSPPVEVTRTFEFTRPCAQGGSVTVAGATTGVIDRENHHAVIETEATRTHQACVLPLRRRGVSIQLDGAPNVAMSARFERLDGMPSGPQTMSFDGAIDWQILDSDRAGTCEITLDIVWERTESGGYKTVDGVVCGREIHVETTWTVEG